LLGGLARCSTNRHDDVHLQTDEVGREGGVPIVLALGPSGLDGDVLSTSADASAAPRPAALGLFGGIVLKAA